MKVLVLGSGGREHALVWKIAQSPLLTGLYCAPGNPGIAQHARCIPLTRGNYNGLLEFALSEHIDLTVVGPEQPLAEGIVDLFQAHGLTIFGPEKRAAELEWSKVFAKGFLVRHSIPTASYRVFERDDAHTIEGYLEHSGFPAVLKVDGLAAGKGVLICNTMDEALEAAKDIFVKGVFGGLGARLIVEEYLEGEEASLFAITDGKEYVTLVPAQDYKRVFDGDAGKNTGGMGSIASTPVVTPGILDMVRMRIIEPTLRGMSNEGRPYSGCLYVGVMITSDGPKVVEFNSRFGDPESQVVLPLFKGDILPLLHASARGEVAEWKRRPTGVVSTDAAACVVLASGGYPNSYSTGREIRGLDDLGDLEDTMVFHAGTKQTGNTIATAGGRVLGVASFPSGATLEQAVARAYVAAGRIGFEGMHFRRDIGRRALKRVSVR